MNVERQKHIFVWIACCLFLVAAIVTGITYVVRRDRAMHGALMELQAANQAGTVFTSDSAAQVLARYFDEPWHRRNDRVLAHYLLGRAHADMGEAPQAIEDYQTAIECADTTDEDCDFRILRNVYGQMAEVFDAQDLAEDELEAQKKFNHYSWVIGDTLEAINGFRRLERPYFLLNQYDQILISNAHALQELLKLGDTIDAAQTFIATSYIHIKQDDFEKAQKEIFFVRNYANIFDDKGFPTSGNEMYDYTIGLFFDGINQLDSAEYYYRRVLAAGELEAGYKGLLSVYSKRGIADSIAMFAPLYADANDAYHDSLRTDEVHKTTSLYNYNRHLRQAQESELKANRRKTFIFLLLSAIVGLCAIIMIIIHRRKKKEQELSLIIANIQEDLLHAANKYSKTKEELHLAESQLKEYVATKQNEINELFEQQQQLRMLYDGLKSKDQRATYYSCKAVVQIRSQAHTRKTTMSEDNWKELKSQFQASFPHFCHMIEQRGITMTENEWKVCILLDLGLTTDDIAALMTLSAQRISNIKAQTNHLLFQESGGTGLSQNLRFAIHPEEREIA